MANRFNGSYRRVAEKIHGKIGPRGILRMVRQEKRSEAELRTRATLHTNTKAHRLNKCVCV